MLLEAVRIVADALADGTIGVTAKLPGVPVDVGDTAPASVTVYDETRNDEVARGRIPAGTVVVTVAISRHRDAELDTSEMRPVKRDHKIPLALRIQYTGEDSSTSTAALYYTWRAVGRSLEALRDNLNSSLRTRNSAQLVSIIEDRGLPLFEPMDDKQGILAREIVVQMRDIAPLS